MWVILWWFLEPEVVTDPSLTAACVWERKNWRYLCVNVSGTLFNYCDVKYPSCPSESRWTSCELLIVTVYLLMNPRLSLLLHCPLGGWSSALSPRVRVCEREGWSWGSNHCYTQITGLRLFTKQISSIKHLWMIHTSVSGQGSFSVGKRKWSE